MLRKTLCIVLALAMVLSLGVITSFADSKGATKSTQNMNIDGTPVSAKMEVYDIYNNNYFKLRDIAYLLKDTDSKFSVEWDEASGLIKIETGKSYTAVGGELSERGDLSKKAKKVNQALLIDGEKVTGLTVYNVADNNFFKLRDLGDALGFGVDWNAADNAIEIYTGAEKPYKIGSYAVACGLPNNISKIENPKSIADYTNNVLYEMYIGNYYTSVKGTHLERRSIKQLCLSLGSLCGAYLNQAALVNFDTTTSTWKLSASGLYLTPAEVYDRNVQAYNKAVEIVKELIASKKLTTSMTDKEKATVIYNYVVNYGCTHGDAPKDGKESIKLDDAYAFLITKKSACSGTTAAYVMLARIAGLNAFSMAANSMKSTNSSEVAGGHVVVYLVLDGKEYIAEPHNNTGLLTFDEMKKYNQYEAFGLDVVRDLVKGDYSTVLVGKDLVAAKQSDGKIKLSFANADILPSMKQFLLKDGKVLIFNDNDIDPGNGETNSYVSVGDNCLIFDAAKWSKDNNGAIATGIRIPYKSFSFYSYWK